MLHIVLTADSRMAGLCLSDALMSFVCVSLVRNCRPVADWGAHAVAGGRSDARPETCRLRSEPMMYVCSRSCRARWE